MPPGERQKVSREMLEVVRLWQYWEKPIQPPREKLLRDLARAEQLLESVI